MHFWYICITFSIFNVISEEFKFSKVFWTRSTFNALILQSLIFLVKSTLILLVFKNTKKNQNWQKNKEVEGPMCFGDQVTLPINRGHNTHKRGKKFTRGQFKDKIKGKQKILTSHSKKKKLVATPCPVFLFTPLASCPSSRSSPSPESRHPCSCT